MSRFMKGLTIFLWIVTALIFLVILYLSFQNQEAAKQIDNVFIRRFAEWYYNRDDFNVFEMLDITYRFRQYGRIVLFMILGFMCTTTIHVTFYRSPWILRTLIAGLGLLVVAIFTERYKVYLPTRHFSEVEMMYSLFGAGMGFATVSAMTLVFSLVKSIGRLIIEIISE